MNFDPFVIAGRQRHNLEQGSAEWLAHRAEQFNAGDAGSMLGCGITGRTELLDELVMGFGQDVSFFQQRIFDNGHRVEALARPLAEQIMGEELYPFVYSAVCDGISRLLGASVDGAPMGRKAPRHWECKSLNDELRAAMPHSGQADIGKNDATRLPKKHRAQMCQQAMVRGSEAVLFTAAKFDDAGNLEDERHAWYAPEPELCVEVLRGWVQFEADLAAHKPVVHQERAKGEKLEAIGLPVVRVMGSVVESNLPQWRELAFRRIEALNTELTTDDQFGQAVEDVKWCDESEKALKKLKADVIGQMATVAEVTTTLDDIVGKLATARKALDGKVALRKVEIRGEVQDQYEQQAIAHRAKMVERIEALGISTAPNSLIPQLTHKDVAADFAKAMYRRQTIKSLHEGCSSELARVKIALSGVTDTVEGNLRHFQKECLEWRHLFAAKEMAELTLKPAEDFQAVCAARIGDAKAAEQKRLDVERERIRQEELARIEREQQETEARATREREAAERETARLAAEAQKAAATPAPAPVASAAPVASSPNVVPMQRAPMQAAAPATLNMGAICQRFGEGFTVSADFLKSLGIEPAAVEKSAKKFTEAQFGYFCEALVAHVRTVQAKHDELQAA